MGLYNKLPDGLREFDVVIAGGGTAGCVVAGRLAAADPSLSVLVIEGGTNNFEQPNVVHPALFPEHQAEGSKTAIFYQANQAKQLANRKPVVPSGGILGGGSSINLMLYTRAQRSDFDSWKTEGWATDDLLPVLKKLETYHGPGSTKHHGSGGPLHISDGGFRVLKTEDDFIQAAEKVGYPEIPDLQDLDANNGVARWLRTVSKDGKRQDAAHAYLHPRLNDGNHPNLHVLVESKVLRVILENGSACGVEYVPNPHYSDSTSKQSVRARKMVVVSCGACGSPSVLERSGIGDPKVLERAAVPLSVNLPGVGHDYQDHNLIFYPYSTNLQPEETNDALSSGRLSREDVLAQKAKLLAWNTCDVSAKIRPSDTEVELLGPEFQKAWAKDFRDNPNRPMMLLTLASSFLGDYSTVPVGQYVSVAAFTAYPYSRGKLHITGPELNDPLDFDLGFFTDPHDIDLKKQMWAYKKHREIMRRTKMYTGEVPGGHPKFSADSKAACVNLTANGTHISLTNGHANHSVHEKHIEDLIYSDEDDKAIEEFLRKNINTTWHSLGTAKMAPRDELGVVDASLNVYGVQGLKVVDLSIAPENVAANTANTAFVIGEKGADIIIKDLGLT